jgi:hypothetical protein
MAAEPKFAKFGAQLADLQVAAIDRLEDAEALFASGRLASAIAMGVYSLEIHLKVRICQRLNLAALPKPFEIHDLEGLLVLSGLRSAYDSAPGVVQKNWEDVARQALAINELRYLPNSNWAQTGSLTFLQQLRDPPDGVLPWLLAQP